MAKTTFRKLAKVVTKTGIAVVEEIDDYTRRVTVELPPTGAQGYAQDLSMTFDRDEWEAFKASVYHVGEPESFPQEG